VAPVEGRAKRPSEEVLAIADERVSGLASSSNQNPLGNLTFRQFWEQVYFPQIERTKRPSTVTTYRSMWNLYLEPQCGDKWIRGSRTPDVQRWLNEISRLHRISKTTLSHVRALLSGMFREAALQDLFDLVCADKKSPGNPVRLVKIPTSAPKGHAGGKGAYGIEEVAQMLQILPEPANTAVSVAALRDYVLENSKACAGNRTRRQPMTTSLAHWL
jgi:hypothetical protein